MASDNGGDNRASNYSEICVVGRDLTEFNIIRYGSFIRRIDMSYNLLMKLRGLEACAEGLEELVLDNNQFIRLDLKAQFLKLHTLSLNKNRISNLTALLKELSSKTPNLRYLSLLGNPVCPNHLSDEESQESDYAAYRCHILYHLPRLRFLDHRMVSSEELAESQKLGHEHLTITPSYTPLPASSVPSLTTFRGSATLSENSSTSNPDQGPRRDAQVQPRKGRQGRRKFKYVGKNSEGNRFIKDSDL